MSNAPRPRPQLGLLLSRIDRFAPECIEFGGPLIKLGLTLASWRCRSAITWSGSANVLSGVPLICGPHRTVIPSANHTLIRARLHEVLSPERSVTLASKVRLFGRQAETANVAGDHRRATDGRAANDCYGSKAASEPSVHHIGAVPSAVKPKMISHERKSAGCRAMQLRSEATKF